VTGCKCKPWISHATYEGGEEVAENSQYKPLVQSGVPILSPSKLSPVTTPD
jgi:hypothetical protein